MNERQMKFAIPKNKVYFDYNIIFLFPYKT